MTTDGMPTEQLDAIEQRTNAAARGPWWNDGHEIRQGTPDDLDPLWIGETCNVDLLDCGDANARFIAAARADVPALLAEVRRLTAALATEQAAHEDTRSLGQPVTGLIVFATAGALVAATVAETISAAVRHVYRLLTRESAR